MTKAPECRDMPGWLLRKFEYSSRGPDFYHSDRRERAARSGRHFLYREAKPPTSRCALHALPARG